MKRALLFFAMTPFLSMCATAPKASDATAKPWNTVPLEQLRIAADLMTEGMPGQQVVIYGNGNAVWNNRVQFQLDEAKVRQILALYDAAHFDALSSSVDGKVLRRRASIRAGNYAHEAFETLEEEDERMREIQERRERKPGTEREAEERAEEQRRREQGKIESGPVLTTLVDSIFDIVAPVSQQGGVSAESVEDGLQKIAAGTLAPETLSLTVMVKPEVGRGDDTGGFMLRIEDGSVVTSTYQGQQAGFGSPATRRLSSTRLREIASKLASFDPEGLPINLYSPRYEEVTIAVMNRRKNILARQFAGLDATKHGEAQTRYDSMRSWLESIRAEALAK
ncbi:MAG: hypothetical protein ACXW3E_14265 [Thermoanaerobaculia bacterium]